MVMGGERFFKLKEALTVSILLIYELLQYNIIRYRIFY